MALVTNIIKSGSAERLLLLVHGYGADERDLGALVPYLDPDGKLAVVLPRAPLEAPGTPGDPAAVVDTDLRVIGYEGLRVCDASVMPDLPKANTHLTTVAIADRVVAMMRG